MAARIIGVLVLALSAGLITAVVTDRPPAGAGAFVATMVVGTIVLVLLRNPRDRETLQQGHVPVFRKDREMLRERRVPVFRVVGEERGTREPL